MKAGSIIFQHSSFLGFLCVCVFLSQAKEKYEKSLEELNKCTPQYTESMEQVFDQCQQHEVKRLTFLKEALLDIKRHLNLTENQRLDTFTLQVSHGCWSWSSVRSLTLL